MPFIDLDIRSLNSTLAAILTALLGIVPLIKRRDRLTWLFALSNLALAIWNLADSIVLFPESHLFKLGLFRLSYIAGIFLVWFFYLFAFSFAQVEVKRYPTVWKSLKITGLILSFFCLTPFLVADIDESIRPFKEIPGPAYPLFIAFLVGGLGFALYQLFSSYRSSEGVARIRLKYMFAALFFSFLEAIIFFLTIYFKEIPPFYFYFQVLYVLIVGYAIAVHRVLDIELLGRNATGWLFTGALSILPFFAAVYLARFLWIMPRFIATPSAGTLVCSILDFSLALTTIRIVQNPHARRLCRLFILIGAWNLAELILDMPPNRFSVIAYRFSYAVACFALLAWFYFWKGFLDNDKKLFSKLSSWFLGSAWLVAILAGFTPLVLKNLKFDVTGIQPADEIPGPAYSLFSIWFLITGITTVIWPISAWWNTREKGKRQLGIWICGSFILAASATAEYFLFVQDKASWYWYPPLQFILAFFLMGALISRMPLEEGRTQGMLSRQLTQFGFSVLSVSLFTGFLLSQKLWPMAAGGFVGGLFMSYLTGMIRQPVQAWVDQTFIFRRLFGHIAKAKEVVQKEWNLDSLEIALPLVTQEVLKTTPYRACTIAIMFDEQPKRPYFHSTYLRLAEGELIAGVPWPEPLVLTFLQMIRGNGDLCLREEIRNLPLMVRELDPLLFEAAVPLKTDGKIVGMVVMGPKEGRKTLFHGEDIKILTTLAQTISQRLGPSVELNLFRCVVNNTLHDVLGHDVGPLVEQLSTGRLIPEDMLKKALRKIRDVLKGLRSYAQGELEEVKKHGPIDIGIMIKTIYELHKATADRKDLQINLNIPSFFHQPRLDPLLVERCIGNLVTNAIKYTLKGSVDLSLQEEERFLVVCVADTGIGIPEDSLKRIFEKGYRVPGKALQVAEGTGIGLANVNDIMVALGGKVRVESEKGIGSKFYLYLPLPYEVTDVKAVAIGG